MISYTLIRSPRKTIAIHITKDAMVKVCAPQKISLEAIDQFVQSKQAWIEKHLQNRTAQTKKKSEFTLQYGDRILYQAREYPIVARKGSQIGFDFNEFYLPENLTSKQLKQAIIKLYKVIAKRDFTNKVIQYAKIMQVSPTAVKISSAKTRWGSCSGKNSINLSWRLILAEETVIDYVVVHELAHIKEHNHGKQFWTIIESIFPDYKEREKGLKTLQQKFTEEDWD